MASGGMDTLPHNGAVITLLAVTGLTHRQSYRGRRHPRPRRPVLVVAMDGKRLRLDARWRGALRQHESALFVSPGVDFCLGRDCAQNGRQGHDDREGSGRQGVRTRGSAKPVPDGSLHPFCRAGDVPGRPAVTVTAVGQDFSPVLQQCCPSAEMALK